MRRGLMVLLSLGVVLGFGSGFAAVARHARGCHAGAHGPWAERGWRGEQDRWGRAEPAAPAPPQQLPPQVYIISPQAPAPVVVTPAAAPPAQAPAPAPTAVAPAPPAP